MFASKSWILPWKNRKSPAAWPFIACAALVGASEMPFCAAASASVYSADRCAPPSQVERAFKRVMRP